MDTIPSVIACQVTPPPAWALAQRALIAAMNAAAPLFQARYTRPDGSLIWRQEWPGMDGSDDGYETWQNWSLFHALGGNADIHQRARFQWEAVTQQFTAYGQIWREFDAFYDWMHHGESSTSFYAIGLVDSGDQLARARARRFAHMYMGLDAAARFWRTTPHPSRTSLALAARLPIGTTTRCMAKSSNC